MNDYSYLHGINRLKKVYGEDCLPPERAKIVISKLKKISDDDWGRVIDMIIGDCRSAPMVKDFEKYAEPYIKAAYRREGSSRKQILQERRDRDEQCPKCNDSGTVFAWSKTNKHASAYGFRCHVPGCIASEHYEKSPIFPLWGPEYEDRFNLE